MAVGFFFVVLNTHFQVFLHVDLNALADKCLCSWCTSAAVREEEAARRWSPV